MTGIGVWLLALGSLAGVLAASGPAGAQSAQRIVGVVNDDVITSRDLDDRLALVMSTSGIPNTAQARDRLAPQVLRSLIRT
jgi:peptidyl-prolyl cis-trans isomerase SurA